MRGFVVQTGALNTRAPLTEKQQKFVHNLQPEFNGTKHVKGIVSMARGDDPASASTSFFIVTADAISPANLKLETIVDGHVMQHGTTADMVFSVPELIAFTSRHVTLRPGDVILYQDSYGNMSVAISGGSAARMLHAMPGQRIRISPAV